MAKFSTTVIAVALFCLFTISIARVATENDESAAQVSLPLSEAAVLRLPSDSVNTVREAESNSAVVASLLPLTKIRFRPINRRFRARSIHPCRHHFKFYPKTRVNGEVSYGNDMLVSTGEKTDVEVPALHSVDHRIPGRWVRMHHHYHHDEDSDSLNDEDRLKKIVRKQIEYKWRKHFHSQEEKRKNSGLMKRVRKFLGHYF